MAEVVLTALQDPSSQSKASYIIPYSVNQLHWHELFIVAAEKTVYHFEAFGAPLGDRGDKPGTAVSKGFGETFDKVGWSLVSMRGRFQVDGNACGIWIQVARDLFIEYVDSHEFGTCTFEAFLHRRLKEQGVLPTERLSGLTLKAAMQTNQKFILEQRADMRGRLVQAAIAGKLAFSEAQLGGFAQELASRKPVEELDDIFEFDIGPPKA